MTLEFDFDYHPADRADSQSAATLDLGQARLDGEPLRLPPAADRAAGQLLTALQSALSADRCTS